MFGFGKKKKLVLSAPAPGKLLELEDVADEVFASKTMGDGFAVEPEGEVIAAPCDGELTLTAKTGHALGMVCDGLEVLLHVGIDTVELDGKGFALLVKTGDRVQRGQALLQVDRAYIAARGKPLTTMVVLTNMQQVAGLERNLADPAAVLTVEIKK